MRKQAVETGAGDTVNRLRRLGAERIACDSGGAEKHPNYNPVHLPKSNGRDSLQPTETAEASDQGEALAMQGRQQDNLACNRANRDALRNDRDHRNTKRRNHNLNYAEAMCNQSDRRDESADAGTHRDAYRRAVALKRTQRTDEDTIDRAHNQKQAS